MMPEISEQCFDLDSPKNLLSDELFARVHGAEISQQTPTHCVSSVHQPEKMSKCPDCSVLA